MPWVRFDDQYPQRRKVESLSDPAFRLNTEAIFWCARNLTDGWVPEGDLSLAAPRRMKRRERFVAELVKQGLWHEPGHSCAKCVDPPNGWVVHDYLDYQPSKAQVEAERAAAAERQRKWREKNRDQNGQFA